MHNLKRRKILVILIPMSTLFLLLLTSTIHQKKSSESESPQIHIYNHIHIAHSTCQDTLYPDLCISTISTFPDLTSKSLPEIISATVNHTVNEARSSSSNCTFIKKKLKYQLTPLETRALEDCVELLDGSVSQLKSAISNLNTTPSTHFHELQTLLSAAMTNQYTCLDGFAYSNKTVRHSIQASLKKISRHVSNSLAMLKRIPGVNASSSEVFPEYGEMRNGFPTWLSGKDRRLLQTAANETKYDLVVAKDGSGNFTTINEAVAAAPNSSVSRFVIHIKAGAYYEYVEVVNNKRMLTFIGDGIGKTLIKGNRSVIDGWTTFRSATLAVVGNGFIAKGITIENYAGPSKHQAVAVRSGSDLSAFYRCSFVGYQDTLYVHSLRQFYRECDVYGTIDFIFGNAAVVFQNSNMYARVPNENQQNIFTAQGREDPNQNTGISILNCKVAATADLIPVQSSYKTYLGRPWKEYSRTVFLLSYIGDLVDPAGFLEWSGDFALTTLYYGEYLNRGPGSNTTARVTWPGYRVINSSTEATQFTVGPFIQGNEWLNSTGIPYFLNLTSST